MHFNDPLSLSLSLSLSHVKWVQKTRIVLIVRGFPKTVAPSTLSLWDTHTHVKLVKELYNNHTTSYRTSAKALSLTCGINIHFLHKMEYVGSALDGLFITKEGNSRGRVGRRRYSNDDGTEYKSKNLHAERRRRQKLSDRLLALRALVPIITNVPLLTPLIFYVFKFQVMCFTTILFLFTKNGKRGFEFKLYFMWELNNATVIQSSWS